MSVSLRLEVSVLLMLTCSCGIATAHFMVKPVSHKFRIYPNARWMILRWTPKKTSSKNKYFTINFVHLIQKVCQILSTFTNQFHCLYLHLHNTPSNIPILFTAISQHVIFSPIHCIGYTALNKTFWSYIWWDVLPCLYDPHWLNSAFIFLAL